MSTLSRRSGTLNKSKAVRDLLKESVTTSTNSCHETEAVLDEEVIQSHSSNANKVKLLGGRRGGLSAALSQSDEMVMLSTMSDYSVEDEPIQMPQESKLSNPT